MESEITSYLSQGFTFASKTQETPYADYWPSAVISGPDFSFKDFPDPT
jgi:hypothetical protein